MSLLVWVTIIVGVKRSSIGVCHCDSGWGSYLTGNERMRMKGGGKYLVRFSFMYEWSDRMIDGGVDGWRGC